MYKIIFKKKEELVYQAAVISPKGKVYDLLDWGHPVESGWDIPEGYEIDVVFPDEFTGPDDPKLGEWEKKYQLFAREIKVILMDVTSFESNYSGPQLIIEDGFPPRDYRTKYYYAAVISPVGEIHSLDVELYCPEYLREGWEVPGGYKIDAISYFTFTGQSDPALKKWKRTLVLLGY